MKITTKFAIVLIFGIIACNEQDKKQSEFVTVAKQELYKIRLKDLSGQTIDLQHYKGKTIFINFWATWCRPCIEEMPSIENLQEILRNAEVVFLLASSESVEEINAFRKAHNFKLNYARIENTEELDIQALPTTFIFNPDGDLVFSEQGYRKWDEKNNLDMILKIVNKND